MFIIITDQTTLGKRLSQVLENEGVFTYVTPLETALFYCREKDIGGVLLDACQNQKDAEAICRTLRRSYPALPILMLAHPRQIVNAPADGILRYTDEQSLADPLFDFCYTVCGFPKKTMTTFYLSMGSDPQDVLYMGYPMPLPNRAYQILRCLLYRAPGNVPVQDLLELCYVEGGSATNVAVQIHTINAEAKRIDPRPLVIYEYKKGYRIRDGILPPKEMSESEAPELSLF